MRFTTHTHTHPFLSQQFRSSCHCFLKSSFPPAVGEVGRAAALSAPRTSARPQGLVSGPVLNLHSFKLGATLKETGKFDGWVAQRRVSPGGKPKRKNTIDITGCKGRCRRPPACQRREPEERFKSPWVRALPPPAIHPAGSLSHWVQSRLRVRRGKGQEPRGEI